MVIAVTRPTRSRMAASSSKPAAAKDNGSKSEPSAKADSKPPAPSKGQDPLGSLEPPVASKSGF